MKQRSQKEKVFNIPNTLSILRLLSVPVLFYLAYQGQEKTFFYLFIISMITDALDGFIARQFNMQTKIGAKLDSLADFAMYLVAIYGLIQLKWELFESYKYSFYLLMFYYIFIDLFSLYKFKEVSSLHLISSKINGILQGLFFFLLFTYGFIPGLYWLIFILATFSFLENIYYLIKLNQMRSDLKGVFWNRL
jgi:phosphatidylglycerophosphate synthase